MQTNIKLWYLHCDARTSAMWLKDSLIDKTLIGCLHVLSTASQLIALERSTILPDIDTDVNVEILQWVLKSRWHYQWLLSYYEALCELRLNVLGRHVLDWNINRHLKAALSRLPDNGYTRPTETTEEQNRADYTTTQVHYGAYRRVPLPFWVRAKAAPIVPPMELSDDETF